MFRTTAELLEERQPLADEAGHFHLVMDGWLANPAELRAELEAHGVSLRDKSDAELVLRAWQTWREQCCDHIDGEFALRDLGFRSAAAPSPLAITSDCARCTGTGTAGGC